MVVAASGTISTSRGAGWVQQQAPGLSLLHAVSCASDKACMALDLTGHAVTFDGTSWAAAGTVPGSAALTYAVSCPSATRCAVARTDGSVAWWNAGTWTAGGPGVLGDANLAAVTLSCPTVRFCALGGSDGALATWQA